MLQPAEIRERYLGTLGEIANAAQRAGRDPDSVRLVVVTKGQPLEAADAALEAGARILGENYAEEAVQKIMNLKSRGGVEWHMIGHVQSRKARLVAEHFALLQSLDSLKLARRLDGFAAELGRVLPVLLEFNVGGEASKHGWDATQEGSWAGHLAEVRAVAELRNLKILGLMTMPPLDTDPESARPYFQRLRRLRDHFAANLAQAAWTELSMGTSADFQVAVEEGATLVRVGQAILGPRPAKGD